MPVTQDIDSYGDYRVSELKIALARELKPIMVDVRLLTLDTPNLSEFAPNLLVILQQTLDTLKQNGITLS